jgi:hypothetical protein
MGPFNYFKLFISLVRNPNVKERLEEAMMGHETVDDFIANVIFKKGSPFLGKYFITKILREKKFILFSRYFMMMFIQ